ncbi:hypothetical protein BH10CHL1_BH10CHL1_40550 [soil metagenome]
MEQILQYDQKIPALAAAGTLSDVIRSWETMLFEMAHGKQFIELQSSDDSADYYSLLFCTTLFYSGNCAERVEGIMSELADDQVGSR